MNQMIDLIAVLMTVLLTGSELAIGVFVIPYSQLAQLLGRVMPLWYAGALVLVVASLFTRASGSRSHSMSRGDESCPSVFRPC